MKIMFVIHSLGHMGGAEKVLVMLANYLSEHRHDISILTMDNKKIIFNLHTKISIYQNVNKDEKKSQHFLKLPLSINQVIHMKTIMFSKKPDIVISFISGMNILATISAKLSNIPILLSEHSSYHRGVKNKFWKFLRRVVYPLANGVVILTEEDKDKYHYVKNLNIIPNPLVLSSNYKKIKRKKIILGVGRLHPVKGFDMLIRAYAKLDLKDWKLVIAGEGEERKNLEVLIDTLNMTDNIELPGLVQDMEPYYRESSIYVLSSRSEGFPGGLCESMGYGCACIAFDCPTGPKEIITDGVDGILVEANNIDKLSEEINKLVMSADQRGFLGRNAKKIIDKLDISAVVNMWEKVIEKSIRHNRDI
jgi:glycosyltransferase involved in cell wall biosynthesis